MRRVVFKARFLSLVIFAMLAGVWPMAAQAASPTIQDFAVLGSSTVTNTGLTIVTGAVGVSPGPDVTGFPPGTATGGIHKNDTAAMQAHTDLGIAYNAAKAATPTRTLTGTDLGGLTLTPGVYFFSSSAQLTGKLTLDFQGGNGSFIFQIGSTLTTASDSSVVLINSNAAQACAVDWQVGSSATLGTATAFVGNIMAFASITMITGASLTGRALALNAAVTLDTNQISLPGGTCAVAPGACNQGSGGDEDKDSDQSKDKDAAADRNESVKGVSERSHEGKDKDGNGHEGCESGDSDKDNSDKHDSDKDNSDKHDSDKDDSKKGKGK